MSKQENFIFGIHAVQSILDNQSERVINIFVVQSKSNARIKELIKLAKHKKCSLQTVDQLTFDKKFSVEGSRHQGIAAELQPQKAKNENDLKSIIENASGSKLFLILDGITDPHNLGACLRSADAFGVHAVIAPKDKSASLCATACKVACGAAETVPFIQVTNLARTLQYLQQEGVWIYGAAGETDSSLYQIDFTGSVAIAMGAEAKGLRRLTRENCDQLFAIPMLGTVESLNVSVATGICLSEVARQRSHK